MSDLPRDAVERIVLEAQGAFYQIPQNFFEIIAAWTAPSILLRPKLSIDGNKWCALYGEDLVDGVSGFGDSPAEAYAAFDRAWHTTLAKAEEKK